MYQIGDRVHDRNYIKGFGNGTVTDIYPVRNLSGADIFIQHFIGKAQIFLIGFPAKTVGRHFFDQLLRQPRRPADLFYFRHRQAGQGAEIPGAVPITRRIADPVFRKITGIRHPAVF